MFRRYWMTASGLAMVSFAFVGCGDDSKPNKPAPDKKTTSQNVSITPKVDEGSQPSDEIQQALAKLSAEDKALAEAQKNCPVGGGELGSMGTPPVVTVKGRKVLICCEGCREKLESDPDTYLAKLDTK